MVTSMSYWWLRYIALTKVGAAYEDRLLRTAALWRSWALLEPVWHDTMSGIFDRSATWPPIEQHVFISRFAVDPVKVDDCMTVYTQADRWAHAHADT